MTETIKCLACTADIEADSCHCDQCGKEIFLCSVCAKPGDQKFCVFDGGDLVPAKQKLKSPPVILDVPQTAAPKVEKQVSKLSLSNQNLGLVIPIEPDAILGRNTGPYVSMLQNFSAISGKHLVFKYFDESGWAFEDIGSTNGTKYSNSNLQWEQVKKCEPNVLVPVADKSFILIANIEFSIQTDYQSSKSTSSPVGSTQRI